MKQIGGWVARDEGATLKTYALDHNIDLSALGSILIVREMSSRRLGMLAEKYTKTVPVTGRYRFTVHVKSVSFAQKFEEQARHFNLRVNNALGLILRAEISEQWLANVCRANMEST